MWRWDQGRLEYFRFENLRLIARALQPLEGVDIRQNPDPLRVPITQTTGLSPKPAHYRVWRNHGRILKSALIALEVGNRLRLTDIGHWLATDEDISADDYLAIVVRRFRYPSPAFHGFNPASPVVFPFAVVLKWLFGRRLLGQTARLTVADVANYLIGNGCTGLETPTQLAALPPKVYQLSDEAVRQLRELLLFISQFSFLNWRDGALELDFAAIELTPEVLKLAEPDLLPVQALPAADLLALATLSATDRAGLLLPEVLNPIDDFADPADPAAALLFTEGQRVYRTHRRIERNRLLRIAFLKTKPQAVCEMCTLDTHHRYPWTKTTNLLELHHLLPLSATPAITLSGTSLADLVALCPSCHRSVHAYYRKWLTDHQRKDFADKAEAHNVYAAAKTAVVV